MPAHAIDLIAVLDGLKNEERIALCYEHPHNSVEKRFSEISGGTPDKEKIDRLKDKDKTGKISLQYTFERLFSYGHKALLAFLLDQNIPTRFTDASSRGKNFDSRTLDDTDPSTAAALQAVPNEHLRADIDPETPEGFRVRNRHMALQALDLAKTSRARIVIQLCGNFHVIGAAHHFPARDSLATNFKELGVSILAIPRLNKHFQEQDIPPDHNLNAKELLVVKGLPETSIHPDPGKEAEAGNAGYVEKLMKHCNLSTPPLTPERYSHLAQQYAEDVRQAFTTHKKNTSKQIKSSISPD